MTLREFPRGFLWTNGGAERNVEAVKRNWLRELRAN